MSHDAWIYVTQWGNSLILMPTALCIAIGLWLGGRRRVARDWSIAFAAGVLLTLATKVAFIGWGVGARIVDFTQISGHSMLASAVLPMAAWWATLTRPAWMRHVAVWLAVALALLIAWSRLALDVHSVSEVIAGLSVGFALFGLVTGGVAPGVGAAWFRRPVVVLLLAASLIPMGSAANESHGLVMRIALGLSGRAEPYTREMFQDAGSRPNGSEGSRPVRS